MAKIPDEGILYDIFWGDTIKEFKVKIDDTFFPGYVMIGNKHIFTSNTPNNDFDKGCVDLIPIKTNPEKKKDDGKRSLYLESYYDGTNAPTDCQIKDYFIDHATMFKLIDILADILDFKSVKLIDGSRIRLPSCEWNLRIINRLFSNKSTFYEKFGYTTSKETLLIEETMGLKNIIVPPKEELNLSTFLVDYMSKHKLTTMQDLFDNMHARCLSKSFPEYKTLEKDIINMFETLHNLTIDDIENRTYYKKTELQGYAVILKPGIIEFIKKSGGKRKSRKTKNMYIKYVQK